ncbi:MAG: DUF935 family protein [Moraxellaceae bacterium]|nr:DUF935 family protein [Moraxellaceae bacterium]
MSNTKSNSKPKIENKEIAVERNLTELEIIDDILTNKLSGEINGYRNLLTDTTVFGTWQQRQTALVQLERQVIPADAENPQDVEVAEFIKTQIENLKFDKILKAMQWGVYYGYAVAEMMWSEQDGKIGINDILVRDRGKFKFKPVETGHALSVQNNRNQLIFTANNNDEVMPNNKFWTYSTGGDTTDNPYGLGLAHYLFWAVLFKKSNIKFWLLGLEKFATSIPHVQYDPNAKDVEKERQRALQAGIALKNGSAIATAKGTLVELLKGASGTADYESLSRYMDEAIALVVLGQVMTSQAVGGQYKGEIQNQVKEDIIKADADLICSSFNDSVITLLTKWNFPNAQPPKLWLLTKDEADEVKQTQAWKNMIEVGYRPTLETVEERLGGEWEKVETQPSEPLQEKEPKSTKDFAENDNLPADNNKDDDLIINSITEQVSEELAPITDNWFNQIQAELDTAESLEELRDKLDELAIKLDFAEYAEVFAKANISAKLAGMASVENSKGANNE